MNIGIDATIVRGDRITGIERYVIELINNLAKINHTDNFEIFCHRKGTKYFDSLTQNFTIKVSPFMDRILTEQLWLPIVIQKSSIDLIHITNLAPSYLIRKRSVITVHDAVPWRYRDTLSKGMKYYSEPILKKFLKYRHPNIITVSDFSKKEISSILKINENKIHTIYNGKNKKFSTVGSGFIKKVKNRYGIYDDYLITIGTIEPRKNLQNLIHAFEKISKKTSLKMVIVGRNGWQKDLEISENLNKRVIFTGFISDADLVPLIAGAIAFLFPSIYEGFGLPLIEAQSCGTPCIVSKESSLPEIAGKSAIYFDPFNINSISKAIENTINNPDLLNLLCTKGINNSKKYSWEKCAEESNTYYHNLV